MSVTTSDSIAGISTSVPAWNAPILPSPMSPSRMMCAFLPEWRGRGAPAVCVASGVRSGGVRQGRVCPAGLLGAVAGVDHQGDAESVGDWDGDRCAGADAVDELA